VKIFSTKFEGSQAFLVVTPDIPVHNRHDLINKSDSDFEKKPAALEWSLSEIKGICSEKTRR